MWHQYTKILWRCWMAVISLRAMVKKCSLHHLCKTVMDTLKSHNLSTDQQHALSFNIIKQSVSSTFLCSKPKSPEFFRGTSPTRPPHAKREPALYINYARIQHLPFRSILSRHQFPGLWSNSLNCLIQRISKTHREVPLAIYGLASCSGALRKKEYVSSVASHCIRRETWILVLLLS
jgi:hypothetical protein